MLCGMALCKNIIWMSLLGSVEGASSACIWWGAWWQMVQVMSVVVQGGAGSGGGWVASQNLLNCQLA
jgi:hypothetical protein